ncbi:MAG: hypothetical protein QXP36_14310 [Conexivisphaerales archaeon]
MNGRFLAIDPSTKSVAYSVFNEKGEILEYGKIEESFFRFVSKNYLYQLIIDKKINEVFIEGQFSKADVGVTQSSVGISYLIGAIFQFCYSHKIPATIIQPYKWQSFLFFHENASSYRKSFFLNQSQNISRGRLKQLSCNLASNLIQKKINDNDIADSICLAIYCNKVIVNNRNISKKEFRAKVV